MALYAVPGYRPVIPPRARLTGPLAAPPVDTPITVDVASFDVDGQVIGLEWANKYDPATFDIDGQVITLTIGTPITVDSAAFDVDGQSISFNLSEILTQAAFDVDGQTVPMDLSCVVGFSAFDIDGQSIAFNTSILVDAAVFDVDGQTVPMDLAIAVTKADLQPAGQDITLTWVTGGSDTPIAVDAAAFSVSGSAVDLTLTTTAEQEPSGGWIESAYEKRYAQLNDEIRRELEEEQERQELADRLERVLVQEGTLTQAQADLIRLRGLAEQYNRDDLPNRARRSLAFAERAQSEFAAKLALREIRRLEEEEEYAVLLLMALD